ncbi:MAG: FimV/HubP family polar landmark protein [Gammaproteobacteria bacterium]
MLRALFTLFFLIPVNITADALLSSPKLTLNSQGERVIEFKIQNSRISDDDILLKEYKSDEPLNQTYVAYTLLEDFSNYKTYSIVLSNSYDANYFNFKLVIKNELAKDIFIFLPSKINSSLQKNVPSKPLKQNIENTRKSNEETITIQPTISENIVDEKIDETAKVVKASEITTMWSIASNIQKESSDISIYQIMWSIYLGNKDAFIDGNINLVRNDRDLMIPSFAVMSGTSDSEARASILAMNESYSLSIAPTIKSLLVLTAPKIKESPKEVIKEVVEDQEVTNIDLNDDLQDPKSIIEQNTKTLEMVVESKIAEDLLQETKNIDNSESQEFNLTDLLFVAFVSILSGVLIALIYIQLKSRQSKKIDYDFEEAKDNSSSIQGLPKGLSIENNKDEQQLDLAVTYFEMGDLENSKSILDEIIRSSDNDKLKQDAQNLLDKFTK